MPSSPGSLGAGGREPASQTSMRIRVLSPDSSCIVAEQLSVQASDQGNGKRAMAADIPAIREIVERVVTRPDVLDACKRRDLGTVITVPCTHGITQGQIAAHTGIPQGRLSEYETGKRIPIATSTFEAFAGL